MGNTQTARCYSRDNRPDCKQVCLGLVVSPEGLTLAYEVFAGNRADVTTAQDGLAESSPIRLLRSRYRFPRRRT